ncbi:carboxyl transferase domain-containing protein [Aeromicrobium piscarium]|uniref:biotin carboxylase n=1 Tax=Aeromicrobium piscarium TaxID=2590901 RepID=A0A554SFL6_9ACTN|nr:carboxyl transferase domain-containing protein [Aeromicrobium piscarium]TSD65131.1 ATP-grasp domain-containing protein [Aeromicrobium piscarium]
MRVVIVNRSDAAMRALHSLREANLGGAEYHSIILHTESDADAPWVTMSDEAVCLGPTMTVDPSTGERRHSFTDLAVLRHALESARADLAWVGWGFVSESPAFARLCEELGIRLAGPSAEVMELLGDKVRAKAHASAAGLNCLPSFGPLDGSTSPQEAVDAVGLPLLVKASAGGGGRGIRVVQRAEELAPAVKTASAEAAAAFGDAGVYAERLVPRAKHLEVQVAADARGLVRAFGVRDCSVQRRRQKVVEESASGLPAELKDRLIREAVSLLEGTGYVGVATVEFLYDLDTRDAYFLEVNTRLQVEHGVTELTTGVDLVRLQLSLAHGEALEPSLVAEHGAAVEVRITAENPSEGFAPSPGRVAVLDIPSLPGVRVDQGISEGQSISSEFDPLIVKVLAVGSDRKQAVARLRAALDLSSIAIEGGATTLGMVRQILASEEFRRGDMTTDWLDQRSRRDETWGLEEHLEDALVLAAVSFGMRERRRIVRRFAERGRREVGHGESAESMHRQTISSGPRRADVLTGRAGPRTWIVQMAGREVQVDLRASGRFWTAEIDGRRVRAVVVGTDRQTQVVIEGHTLTFRTGEDDAVRALAPCVVTRVLVRPGQRVEVDDVVATTESMKMEASVHATAAGVVEEVAVVPGQQVSAGQSLLRIVADGRADDVRFPSTRFRPMATVPAGDHLAASIGGWCTRRPAERRYDTVSTEQAQLILSEIGRLSLVPGDEPTAVDGELDLDEVERQDALYRRAIARARLSGLQPDLVDLLRSDGAMRAMSGWSSIELAALMQATRGPLPAVHRVLRALIAWRELEPSLGPEARSWLATERDLDELEEAHRFEFWRLSEFDIAHVRSTGSMHLIDASARSNPADRRVLVFVHLAGDRLALSRWTQAVRTAMHVLRVWCVTHDVPEDLDMHRIVVETEAAWDVVLPDLRHAMSALQEDATSLGLQQVVMRIGRGEEERVLHIPAPARTGMTLGTSRVSPEPIRPLTRRQSAAARMARRGLHEPWSVIEAFASQQGDFRDLPPGSFSEHDLEDGKLVPVDREPGGHAAGLVVGTIRSFTEKHPEGMLRVAIFSDPSRSLGALAAPECDRIVAALDLAERLRLPVEWFAVSAGARVAMDSGTENMDAVASALRRIVEFTQAGGVINILVTGVTVGAQPYFNAEATMLMHTRGILVMVGDSSMVLTGKDALDFAGAVSADTNQGIGGYERIMGPNGQAQYHAETIEEAYGLLLRHYEFSYVSPGEPSVRPRGSTDPADRMIGEEPHRGPESAFMKVADIFDPRLNPERKAPFSMRSLMKAVIDRDSMPLERWGDMHGADTAIVWDAYLAGTAVSLVGVESHGIERSDGYPLDGPSSWTAGTLFPRSSKKIARAINAASGIRPLVVLANLAGFDGSPESLRLGQLEFGAEIGRSIVNFSGPIVLCVVARYHGGAFVVFSQRLNDSMRVLAVDGAKASVIGGAAAASVVFQREVEAEVRQDSRVRELQARAEERGGTSPQAEIELAEAREEVRHEVRRRIAERFDAIHTIERALSVGSVHRIIEPESLRAALVEELALQQKEMRMS